MGNNNSFFGTWIGGFGARRGKKASAVACAVMLLAVAFAGVIIQITLSQKSLYANAGPDRTVDVNEPVIFDGSGSLSRFNTIVKYTWYFGDSTIGHGMNPTHSYGMEGVYTVILVVLESTNATAQDSVVITVHNEAPIAHAGIDKSTYEDESVSFNASGTKDTPSDQASLTYVWEFGDGSTGTGPTQTHIFTKEGLYNVILTVTDNDGVIDKDIITVNVMNKPPTADAGIDKATAEDSNIIFNGSLSADTSSDASTLTYSWNFGDDSTGSGKVTTHNYTKAGTYIAYLTVTDDDGATSTDSLAVEVANVNPNADAGWDKSVSEDELVFFAGSGSDTPSDQPLLEYAWDFGDGTSGSGQFPTHTYRDEGLYVVTLIVTDDDWATGVDSLNVTVGNIQPTVDAGPDMVINEDVIVQFRGYAHDTPSDEQSLDFSWNFGDGTSGTGQNPTHTYSSQGTYLVTLTVTDDGALVGTDYLTVTAVNIPPTAIATYSSPYPVILAGDILTFEAQAMDSSSDQSGITFSWDFGDGTTGTGSPVTHSYADDGIYEVILTATDDDGDTAQDILVIVVEKHSFEMDITPLIDKIMPGEKAEYVVTLRNTGTMDDAFDLVLTPSFNSSWAAFDVKHMFVEAKSVKTVVLEVQPPEDFPLDQETTYGFIIEATCVHDGTEMSNAPLMGSFSEDVTAIITYNSRLRWAQAEVESLITDPSGGNSVDATLLKALEEISEALFFASTPDSPEFDYVKSIEHVKNAIHDLETVGSKVPTDHLIDLLCASVNDMVRDTIDIAQIQAGADNIHVIDAWALFEDAQDKIAVEDYANGMEQYKNAYMEAERADGEWVPRMYTATILSAIAEIDDMLLGPYSPEAKNELQLAKDELNMAIYKSGRGDLQGSFVNDKAAVEHLLAAEGHGAPGAAIAVEITECIGKIVEMLIVETQTHVGMEVNDIKQAWQKLIQGWMFVVNELYPNAIDKFDRAYNHALLAEDWIPIADAGSDQVSLEDEVVSFDGSNSRDRDGIVLFYEWDFGDSYMDYGVFVSHVYKDAGTYNLTLMVTDNEGNKDIDTAVVTIGNVEPVAPMIIDYAVRDNSAPSIVVHMDDLVIFEALYEETPSDLPGLVFHWDFGDGTTGFGAYVRHTYTYPGVYDVVLTVTDEDGDFGTATTTITVNNVVPRARLTYSQVAFEDEVVYLSGNGWDTPSDIKTLKFTWDFGDGTTGIGEEVTHVYTNEGIYSVTLTVKDDHGDIGTCTINISVINPPPVADAGWAQYSLEDSTVVFNGTALDTPSDQTSLIYYWYFGDGTGGAGKDLTYSYAKAGTYFVALVVTDDNGDAGYDWIPIFVENVEPAASMAAVPATNEDAMVTFSGSCSDTSSDLSSITYSWDFGDSSAGSGPSPTHVYTQAGVYTVVLTVTDDDGASDTVEQLVTILNVVPNANAGSEATVDEDELVFFEGTGSDTASDQPVLKYKWAFDDLYGISPGFGRSPTHTYITEDDYIAVLTVTDDDGSSATDTMKVTVRNVPPYAFAGPDLYINSGPMYLTFKAIAFDTPSDQYDLKYSWDFDTSDAITVDATGIYASYYYNESGVYELRLTVNDDNGAVTTDTATITIVIDSDGDGLPDEWELANGLDPFDNSDDHGGQGDPDNDILTNMEEFWYGTKPLNPDTDDDYLIDGWEVKIHGTDPLNPDSDYDSYYDGEEVTYEFDPLNNQDPHCSAFEITRSETPFNKNLIIFDYVLFNNTKGSEDGPIFLGVDKAVEVTIDWKDLWGDISPPSVLTIDTDLKANLKASVKVGLEIQAYAKINFTYERSSWFNKNDVTAGGKFNYLSKMDFKHSEFEFLFSVKPYAYAKISGGIEGKVKAKVEALGWDFWSKTLFSWNPSFAQSIGNPNGYDKIVDVDFTGANALDTTSAFELFNPVGPIIQKPPMGIDLGEYLPEIEESFEWGDFKLEAFAEGGLQLGLFGSIVEDVEAKIDSAIKVFNDEIIHWGLDEFNYKTINLESYSNSAGSTLKITSDNFRYAIIPALDYYHDFGIEASANIHVDIGNVYADLNLGIVEWTTPDLDWSWSSPDDWRWQKGERADKSTWGRWASWPLAEVPATNDLTIVESATILDKIGTEHSHEHDVQTNGVNLISSLDQEGSLYWDMGLSGIGNKLGFDFSKLLELNYSIDFGPHLDLNSKLHTHAVKDTASPGEPYFYRMSMDSDGVQDGKFWLSTEYSLVLKLNLPEMDTPALGLPGLGSLPAEIEFPQSIELLNFSGDLTELFNWDMEKNVTFPVAPGIDLEIKVDWYMRDGVDPSNPIEIEEDSSTSPGKWETTPIMHFALTVSLKLLKIFWIEMGDFKVDLILKGEGNYTGDLRFTNDSAFWPGQVVDSNYWPYQTDFGIYFNKPGDYYTTRVYPRFWQNANKTENFTVELDSFRYNVEKLALTARFTGSLYFQGYAFYPEHDWEFLDLKSTLEDLNLPLGPIDLDAISDENTITNPPRPPYP
jgi:PKD repeat protein